MNTLIKIAAALGFASVLLPASAQTADGAAAAPAAAAPAAAAPAAAPPACAPVACTPAAPAEKKSERSGLYLGASVGQAQITDDPQGTGGLEASGNSTAYNVFVGYRWELFRWFDLAAEVGYTDLGTLEGNAGATPYQYKAQGLGASALAIIPISIFDFYGRLGVAQVNLDKTINGVTTASDGTAGVYGVGVGLRFWHLGFRLEYDVIEVPEVKSTDVGMVSVYFQF